MEKRQELLLKLIVESYIKTAEPVGSNFLVLKSGLDISAPTVRNEMRVLEEQGYLTHPHTSAGRIPTELGYQYYVENLMEANKIKQKTKTKIEDLVREEKDDVKKVKAFAKLISEETGEAVIVAFDSDNIYYTGISSLFSQPEFRDNQSVTSISNIFDNCENGMGEMFETIGQEINILIGQNNPFGNACGLVATKFGGRGLLIVVGPTRMDYGESVGLLQILKLLNE